MRELKHWTRVLVEHSEDCFSKHKGKDAWSGILDKNKPTFYGNAYANDQEERGSHLWYRMVCNDPNCPAIKAVHSNVLRTA